jgi:hypothetical protein
MRAEIIVKKLLAAGDGRQHALMLRFAKKTGRLAFGNSATCVLEGRRWRESLKNGVKKRTAKPGEVSGQDSDTDGCKSARLLQLEKVEDATHAARRNRFAAAERRLAVRRTEHCIGRGDEDAQ